MALPSQEGRELIRAAMKEAYLLRLTQMALTNGRIDKEAYIHMQAKIKSKQVLPQITCYQA